VNNSYKSFLKSNLSPFARFIQRRGFFLDIFLGLLAGAETLRRLLTFSDPPGLNGYFYLKQTKTLAANFTFYFSDHSLAFLPLVLLRWLVGSDLHAFQAGLALALAGCCWAVCFFVNQLKMNAIEKLVAKLLVIFALFSSIYFAEFSLNFYKNLIAAMLLVWCAGFLLKEQRRLALLFFCLAFFTHKSVALIGAIYFGFFLISEVKANLARRESARKMLLLLSGSMLLASVFLLLFLLHFPKASAFLNFAENSFALPAPRLHWWKDLFLLHRQRGLEALSWAITLVCLALGFRKLTLEEGRIFLTVAGVFVLAAHPFQPAAASALGYRLLLLSPLLVFPLAALAYSKQRSWLRFLPAIFLVISFLPHFSPLSFSMAAIKKETRSFSSIRSDVEKIPSLVSQMDHLTSHHGMEFFVDYVTDIRSRSFLADPSFTGKKYRLVYVAPNWLKNDSAADDLDQVKLLNIGTDYFLIEERDWDNLSGQNNFPGTWKNPSHLRPAHVYE
jgi:hypothetical protein